MPQPPTRHTTLGDHIRQHRQWAGLTQDEVVRRSGVDKRTYQRIERGETDARISWLMYIADAIGIPLGRLVEPPHQ